MVVGAGHDRRNHDVDVVRYLERIGLLGHSGEYRQDGAR